MNGYNRFEAPREREVYTSVPPEQQNGDFSRKNGERSRLIKRVALIIAIILLAFVLLNLLKAVLLNPLSELRLRTAIFESCRITIVSRQIGGSYARNESVVKVDGNIFSVETNFGEPKYYEIENGKTYCYEKNFLGNWQRSEVFTDADERRITERLLDPSSYERVPGRLAAWQLRDGVDVGYYSNVELRRKGGKITISVSVGLSSVTFTFDRIGITDVDLPNED